MLFARRTPLTLPQKIRLAAWPTHGWRRSFRYAWMRVLRLAGSPHAIAMGFAVGVFASWTPFVGLHILMGFLIAFLIGGNLLAAGLGTVVGNPFTFPFIWMSSYELGNAMLGIEGEAVPAHEVVHAITVAPMEAIGPIFRPWLFGSLPLGLLCSAIAYVLVRTLVGAYQGNRRERLAARRLERQAAAP